MFKDSWLYKQFMKKARNVSLSNKDRITTIHDRWNRDSFDMLYTVEYLKNLTREEVFLTYMFPRRVEQGYLQVIFLKSINELHNNYLTPHVLIKKENKNMWLIFRCRKRDTDLSRSFKILPKSRQSTKKNTKSTKVSRFHRLAGDFPSRLIPSILSLASGEPAT